MLGLREREGSEGPRLPEKRGLRRICHLSLFTVEQLRGSLGNAGEEEQHIVRSRSRQ